MRADGIESTSIYIPPYRILDHVDAD